MDAPGQGQKAGLRQEAESLRRIEHGLGEASAGRTVAVRRAQRLVAERVVGAEQRLELAAAVEQHALGEGFRAVDQRRTERVVVVGIGVEILGQRGNLIDLEPLAEESAGGVFGFVVSQHAARLRGNVDVVRQLSSRRCVEQRLIRASCPR